MYNSVFRQKRKTPKRLSKAIRELRVLVTRTGIEPMIPP